MSNPIPPTPGRNVLVTVADSTGLGLTIPGKITHVHSDEYISGVLFSAFSDAGTDGGGTRPFLQFKYDESGKPGTWRWMDYQKGQAAKAEQAQSVTDAHLTRIVRQHCEPLEAQLHAAGMAMAALQEQLSALNAKQPERQRLDVADPTPIVPVPPVGDPPPGSVAPVEGQPAH